MRTYQISDLLGLQYGKLQVIENWLKSQNKPHYYIMRKGASMKQLTEKEIYKIKQKVKTMLLEAETLWDTDNLKSRALMTEADILLKKIDKNYGILDNNN